MPANLGPLSGALRPEEMRVVQDVFNRIKGEGLMPEALEEQRMFAAYILRMYLRGMVIPERLYALCYKAAKSRMSASRVDDQGKT